MNYNYRTPLNPASSEQQLMIKQQRRMARTKLAQDFCQLLNSPNSPNLHQRSHGGGTPGVPRRKHRQQDRMSLHV